MSKILVIDSDERVFDFIVDSFYLSQNGDSDISFLYEKTGNGAITSLEANPDVDLVITALKLPDTTGITLASRIKHSSHDLPIILFTAYNNKKIITEAKNINIGFWYKPELLGSPLKLVKAIRNEVKRLNGYAGKPKFTSKISLAF